MINKQISKKFIGLGFILWLIGYVLSFILFLSFLPHLSVGPLCLLAR